MKKKNLLQVLLLALCIVSIGAGCGEAFVDPFENNERFFNVYGYIDAREYSHKIRVVPISRQEAVIRRQSDLQSMLDAEVTLTDLVTEEVIEWEYELEPLSDGTYAHIFRSNFIVQPGREYRLDVTRADGVKAWATTKVPNITDSSFFLIDTPIVATDSSISQRIMAEENLNVWGLEAIYNWRGDNFNKRVFVPYEVLNQIRDIGSWETLLSLSEDQVHVRQSISEALRDEDIFADTPLILVSTGIRMIMLDSGWQMPENGVEITELTPPADVTNIHNGYGYFGSIGFYIQEWDACDMSAPLGYEFAETGCGNDRDEDE